jgi:hypothetical protein
MNNPIMMLVQAMNNGGNPLALLQQMASQNPQAFQALQMMQGKNPQQLEQMARGMAQERGIDINQMIRQLGINNANFR